MSNMTNTGDGIMLDPIPVSIVRERVLIKWWRGWYALGWRGWLARKLLAAELDKF